MSNFSFFKTEDGMPDIVQYNVDRFKSTFDLAGNILRGPSELSVAERELIFAYVSESNSCDFCYGAHKALAQAFGIEEGLLDELVRSDKPTMAEEKIQPCLMLSRKAAKNSYRIERADIEAVMSAGWSEETAHDVISIAAFATFCNILVSGHGVAGSPAYFQREVDTFGPGGDYQNAKTSSF